MRASAAGVTRHGGDEARGAERWPRSPVAPQNEKSPRRWAGALLTTGTATLVSRRGAAGAEALHPAAAGAEVAASIHHLRHRTDP